MPGAGFPLDPLLYRFPCFAHFRARAQVQLHATHVGFVSDGFRKQFQNDGIADALRVFD